jgi:deoxyribonuclease-2
MTTKPYERVTKLQSMGSITYISFAKSKFFGSDLYSDMVAPYYNANLLVETWQNGVGKLPSNCSELTVENVLDMKLSGDPFKETTDHSKWAISKSSEQGLVCIGDINRMVCYIIYIQLHACF